MSRTLPVRGPGPKLAILAVSLLVATACGSTAPTTSESGAPASGSSVPSGGLSLAPGATGGGTGAGTGSTVSGGGTGGAGSSGSGGGGYTGSTGSGTTGGGTGSGAGGAGASAVGPGITATTIYVGIGYSVNNGAANEAFAGTSLAVDQRKAYNAMIDEINKSGGIAGRKISPIYAAFDATSSQTIDQQAQSACAKWTEDNKVFFILSDAGSGVIQECAKKADAVQYIPAGNSVPEDFQKYPHYFETSSINLVRMGPVSVTGLKNLGYFDQGAKLGILTWDDPPYREALQKGYLPALKRAGITPAVDPVFVHSPQTFGDLGGTSADVNSAVLKFQSAGVDHVMILDGPSGLCAGACLGFEFLNRAKSQSYFPRYGFNDYNDPQGAYDAGLYPAEELKNSVAVVWTDADEAADAGWHKNPAREQCYALMRKHSVDMGNGTQQFAARSACEQFWFMRLVTEKLGAAPLNADNFMSIVDTIGWGFQPVDTYESHFSASQHDGASAVRNQRWNVSCKCYKYTTIPYRV